jgi:hypothetical protein
LLPAGFYIIFYPGNHRLQTIKRENCSLAQGLWWGKVKQFQLNVYVIFLVNVSKPKARTAHHIRKGVGWKLGV